MRLVVLLALSAALFAGCGDDEPKVVEAKASASESPTQNALTEACGSIGDQLPTGGAGSWARVLDEAEHYRNSDDAEVRDLAADVIEAVQPVADFEESPGSMTDQERMIATFQTAWQELSPRCGWAGINLS